MESKEVRKNSQKLKIDPKNSLNSINSHKKYEEIIKSFKSIKKDFVQDKDKSDSMRNSLNNGAESLLNNYGKSTKKETEDHGLSLVNQLRNQLHDFEKNFQDLKEDKKEEDINQNKPSLPKTTFTELIVNKENDMKVLMQERIFWSKEKMQKIREKFIIAKLRIQKKTEDDFNDLRKCIEEGEISLVTYYILILGLLCLTNTSKPFTN
jgi:hypothetical protein